MIGFSLFMWAWQVEPRRVETVTAAMEMPQWKRKDVLTLSHFRLSS